MSMSGQNSSRTFPRAAPTQGRTRATAVNPNPRSSLRVVHIGDGACGESSEHIRETKHVATGILPGDELLLDRRPSALLDRTLTQPEVARILLEEHRVNEVAEEVAVRVVGQGRAVTLGEPLAP